jgi:hypothetical protein
MHTEFEPCLPGDAWEGIQKAFARHCPNGVYNETAGNIRRGIRGIQDYLAAHPGMATVSWGELVFGDIGSLEAHLAWLESARDDEVYDIGKVLNRCRWNRSPEA